MRRSFDFNNRIGTISPLLTQGTSCRDIEGLEGIIRRVKREESDELVTRNNFTLAECLGNKKRRPCRGTLDKWNKPNENPETGLRKSRLFPGRRPFFYSLTGG